MSDERNVHNAHKECIIQSAEERQKTDPNLFKLQVPIPASDGWEGIEAEWLWTERAHER